mgnify:CR=1 FL=1
MALISLPANSKSLLVRVFATFLTVGALMAIVLTGVAEAYGTPTDPPSRTYGCWNRWHTDPLNPVMPQADPMCWRLWQSDPSARWYTEGVYRDGAEGPVPNGRLCSAGQARYGALDEPGRWQAVPRSRQFTVTVIDRTRLGADYLRVYLTKQGYDATTTRLGWNHLDLVMSTGRITNVGQLSFMLDAANRTGRHVVYSVWQLGSSDRAYYSCTDIIFQ